MTTVKDILPAGASVGIIGAGPAGSFFALHLIERMRVKGTPVRVTLIDRKAFGRHGPSGCNMCAGAIGTAMVGKLERMELPIDPDVIRRIADGYEIHGKRSTVAVRNEERGGIYTVFRGGGPTAPAGRTKSFDQFLLDAALARGAAFVHRRVEGVERIPRGYRVRLSGDETQDFDFLSGAFGVNTTIARALAIGYVPPSTWHTVQAEIPADNAFIMDRLRNRIHIVAAAGKAIRFLAITPKDDVLTLTGIGEHVRIADLERERRENPVLARLLPEGARVLCHCHPQVPVGTARKPYADRFAIIGDAFISRYLKNGIESSYETAKILAEAVAEHGVSEKALRDHFYRPCLRLFRYDNAWGKVLFGIYENMLRRGRLSDAYMGSVAREAEAGMGRQSRILWAVFAGDAPYRDIARDALALRSVAELVRNLLRG
jgi:flavin-dependent dehydrogenase